MFGKNMFDKSVVPECSVVALIDVVNIEEDVIPELKLLNTSDATILL